MPSQITHLAVAKRFLAKHVGVIKDEQEFLDGAVVPDLHPDKTVSHCGVRTEKVDVIKYNAEKVNPSKFLETHDLSVDFNKGQYLHLWVDDQYYNHFLLEYFRTHSFGEQITTDMYETTRRDDAYLREKYGVDYGDTSFGAELQVLNDDWDAGFAEKRKKAGYHYEMPYQFVDLDKFIEAMADTQIPQA